MISCKIENWTLKLNETTRKIVVQNGKNKPKEYLAKVFETKGMRIFPKQLYCLISRELKYANIYDKFLDKFYDWDEKNNHKE